jgi:hypothetical protein
MECNFQWKIYRQSQSNNIHICLVNTGLGAVVEMTSKKFFEIKSMLRSRCIFFGKDLFQHPTPTRNLPKKFRPGNYFQRKRCFQGNYGQLTSIAPHILPAARPVRPACVRGTAPATNKKNAAQGRVFDGGRPGLCCRQLVE